MSKFIERIKRMGDRTVTIDGTVYKLKTGEECATFHVIPEDDDIPEPIDISYPELKALSYLLKGE